MSVDELSTSTQNYLKVIWALREWADEPVTTSAVAEKTGLRLSTVSDAIRKLAEQGLVAHARYGAVSLTADGASYALAMVRRHRIIETFLVSALGYRWDQVHDEAERLEHAVSDFLVDRMDEVLGHPDRDPHGDPIPSKGGDVERPTAHRLTGAPPGSTVVVERIADDDPELLQHFASLGLGVGSTLRIEPGAPYSGALVIRVGGSADAASLGAVATDAVWVSPS